LSTSVGGRKVLTRLQRGRDAAVLRGWSAATQELLPNHSGDFLK
jgi:hypothetical protein